MNKWFVLILVVMLSGCSNYVLSKKRQANIHSFEINKPSVLDAEYVEPIGWISPDATTKIGAAGFGGAIPAIIGATIDNAMIESQQKKFVENYGQYFDSVKENISDDLQSKVNVELAQIIKEHPFFALKEVKHDSLYHFEFSLEQYGLRKVDYEGTDVKLSLYLLGVLKFYEENGPTFLDRHFSAVANESYSMIEYSSDPAFLEKATQSVLVALEERVNELINEMLTKESDRQKKRASGGPSQMR